MATVGLRLGPADHGRRMTREDFREADAEEGQRYDLSRGVLEVVEALIDPHDQVICNCQGVLPHHHRQHPGLIRRIGAEVSSGSVSPSLFPGMTPTWPSF